MFFINSSLLIADIKKHCTFLTPTSYFQIKTVSSEATAASQPAAPLSYHASHCSLRLLSLFPGALTPSQVYCAVKPLCNQLMSVLVNQNVNHIPLILIQPL